ncbi:hypothetical protein M0R45_036314 [Rubus argutus]|uniref:Phosphoglycerate mutase n=1 Tax=Rubus argutus TaxID=59490 RepID=A0AAW1VWN6_RUBAR
MAQTTSLLRNKYWVLRHGRSIPNERGLIVSSMENGTLPEYQLAPGGVNQAQLAGELFQKVLKENSIPIENGAQCKVMENLRERFFGPSFELRSLDEYHEIYCTLDEQDPLMRPEGGERVDDVASRLAEAIVAMESLFQGCTILVVSHGDPLQILQALLNATKLNTESSYDDLASRIQALAAPSILSQHRKFNLRTGELRAVI